MNSFKKFYLWGMNVKFFMGIYFAALVFLSGLLTAVLGGDSLRLLPLFEMLLIGFVIALIQAWILPSSVDFSHGIFFGRSIVWVILSAVLVVIGSVFGKWFGSLPLWCSWVLGLFMLVGLGAILVGLRFEQEADTLHLNQALQEYQKKQ